MENGDHIQAGTFQKQKFTIKILIFNPKSGSSRLKLGLINHHLYFLGLAETVPQRRLKGHSLSFLLRPIGSILSTVLITTTYLNYFLV